LYYFVLKGNDSNSNNCLNNRTKKILTVRRNLNDELNASKISNLYESKQTIMVSSNLSTWLKIYMPIKQVTHIIFIFFILGMGWRC